MEFTCCFVLVQLNELWPLRLEVLENQDHGILCQLAAAWKWELKIAGSESPGSCLLITACHAPWSRTALLIPFAVWKAGSHW